MAIQAQYPSNFLLFNMNGQEAENALGIDSTMLQPYPLGAADATATGFVLDQPPHMRLFNNGVLPYPKKRGRESIALAGEAATTATATTTTNSTIPAANMSPFNFRLQNNTNQHQYRQRPQIISLSQLQNCQQNRASVYNNVVSTGLRLSFAGHHQQQQQQKRNLIASNTCSSSLLSSLSGDFADQIMQHTDEINQFIHAQGEQLRRTLAEKRQRHYHALLVEADDALARKLRGKEAEVDKANRRNAELEARARQLTAEVQAWQAKARSQEAQAASLQAKIEQAMLSAGTLENREGEGGVGDAEDAESAYMDPERVRVGSIGGGGGSPACKACRKQAATVVVLPCRHLCVCTVCNALVQACPLCLSVRNGGVEVFLA